MMSKIDKLEKEALESLKEWFAVRRYMVSDGLLEEIQEYNYQFTRLNMVRLLNELEIPTAWAGKDYGRDWGIAYEKNMGWYLKLTKCRVCGNEITLEESGGDYTIVVCGSQDCREKWDGIQN